MAAGPYGFVLQDIHGDDCVDDCTDASCRCWCHSCINNGCGKARAASAGVRAHAQGCYAQQAADRDEMAALLLAVTRAVRGLHFQDAMRLVGIPDVRKVGHGKL